MKDFESQVARAAVRLRDGENGRLSVKPVLRRPRRLSWGWVATPAAAVAGIFIGVGWGRMSGTSMPATAQVWDTVVERRVVYDTVTLVRQEGPAAVQPRSVRRPPSPSSTSVRPAAPAVAAGGASSSPDTLGRCILDDGVDYSLLCEALW